MLLAVVAMNWSHPGEVAKYIRETGLSGRSADANETVRIDGKVVKEAG